MPQSAAMQNYEKLGAFYLGREHDAAADQTLEDLLLYDSKDLTTHAMCVGMTGSGKTGLCVSLIEEAAIDGIPVLAIDPKGDLGNLLLTFPKLRPQDFAPWVDHGEATRNGQTPAEYAASVASLWKKGIGEWGQDGKRIERLRQAVDVSIYTPGSQAGLPLTVLKSFDAPPPALLQDGEAFAERVNASVSGLLGLLGIDADPMRSREHVLLANILHRAWQEGRNLTLADLIRAIQAPQFKRVGVLDLDSFFPPADRFQLAMSINSLLASPSFAVWMEGEPLDIQRLLWTPEGKPRVTILSIAHLTDAQRMFFVTTLLTELLAWVRTQPGTSSLRALFYMDEVFGYFPPVANPPSKGPMLTLLKQARAFGLGCMLATQNPVDLDYKGLSNTGTWFIGRLQTERDKARLLDGLEGAATATGAGFDRGKMEALISGLGKRVFLMNNVHDDEPVLFHTRWALSYLRGPLTRNQIETLMAPRKAGPAPVFDPLAPRAASAAVAAAAAEPEVDDQPAERPVLPTGIVESFAPSTRRAGSGDRIVYRPSLLGQGRAHYVSARMKIDLWEDLCARVPIDEDERTDPWDDQVELFADVPDLDSEPEEGARFAELPPAAQNAKKFEAWKKKLRDFVYRERRMTQFKCAELKEVSKPRETEGDFRVRLAQALREHRDLKLEKLRARYTPKLGRLRDRIVRAQQKVEEQQSQVKAQQTSTVVSFGKTILGALFGRKVASAGNVGRAATTMRSAGRIQKEKADVVRAEETLERLEVQLGELEAEFQEAMAEVQDEWTLEVLEFDVVEVAPRKSDIDIMDLQLVWLPFGVGDDGMAEPLFS